MKPNPSAPITTIQTSMPGDPAVDWTNRSATEALSDHRRKRDAETLAKIPTQKGEHLTHYTLRALTRVEYRYLSRLERGSFEQLEAACEMVVTDVRRGPHHEVIPTREVSKGVTAASEEGSETLYECLGPSGMRELGALAIARAELGDTGPFALPPGTAPAFLPR